MKLLSTYTYKNNSAPFRQVTSNFQSVVFQTTNVGLMDCEVNLRESSLFFFCVDDLMFDDDTS